MPCAHENLDKRSDFLAPKQFRDNPGRLWGRMSLILLFNDGYVKYPVNQALIKKQLFIVQTQRPVYAGLLAKLEGYWSILDLAVAERQ